MSETIIVKKKKKADESRGLLTIEQAIEILKPFVTRWKKQDEAMAIKMYEVYKKCAYGDWKKVLDGLNFPSSTWYKWVHHFGFRLNYPENANRQERPPQVEVSDAEYENEVETEYDTTKYQETYTILKNAQRLSTTMFKVVEKQELIKELQSTIKKLTGLLLKLESGIDD